MGAASTVYTLTSEFTMWTLDGADVLASVLPQQTSSGEGFVTNMASQFRIIGRVNLAAQVILQLGVVGEPSSTVWTCDLLLLKMRTTVFQNLVLVTPIKFTS